MIPSKPTGLTDEEIAERKARNRAGIKRRVVAQREQDLTDVGDLLATDPTLSVPEAAKMLGLRHDMLAEKEAETGRIIGAASIPVHMERLRTLDDIGMERRRSMLATAMGKWEDMIEEVNKPGDLQRMVVSLAVLIDKSRLETGLATERISQLSRFEDRHTLELEARARLTEMMPDVAAQLPPPIDPIANEHRETLRQVREEQEALARVGYVDRSHWQGLHALNK